MKKIAKAVLSALPRGLQRRVRDAIEEVRRRRPAPHRGLDDFGLAAAQVYPRGVHFDDCLRDGIAGTLDGLVIGGETPVASLGSCFADELASHLREGGFRYVVTEPGVFPASANWGRVYTIPAFRQIAMYSTTGDFPMPIERAAAGWFDPLRDAAVGSFATREEAANAIRQHRGASRRAFAEAQVLIVTLGQNEAWVDRDNGLAWARRPPNEILEASRGRFEATAFSFEDDVRWLADALQRLRALNPGLDVLLTVSPVASYATFWGAEVVTQSFAGKCTLRVVAERIVGTVPRVWYFPSFEMALAYNPHTLAADNRHVKNATVDRILALLHRTIVRR